MVTFCCSCAPRCWRSRGGTPGWPRITGRLTAPLIPEPGRTQAVRCVLAAGADNWELTPTGPQGSHQLTSMLGAGALALIEPGQDELAAGTRVRAELVP